MSIKPKRNLPIDRRKRVEGVKLPELKKGRMTRIAHEMGYDRVIDIPNSKIPEFVDRLVDRYGRADAIRMINAQVVFRKRMPDDYAGKKKFLLMKEYYMEHYSSESD